MPKNPPLRLLPLGEAIVKALLECVAADFQGGREEAIVDGPWLLTYGKEAQLFVGIKLTVYAIDLVSESFLKRFAALRRCFCRFPQFRDQNRHTERRGHS